MKAFYLLAAIGGGVFPWIYNIQAFDQFGADFTPQAFFMSGFEGSPILGSLAADFWIGSIVALVWMVVEARRLGIKHWWFFVVWTFVIAWASALPLFLFVRERHLERTHEGA